MLLKQATLEAIRDGNVHLAFRRWKRPAVKAGGTLLTSIGLLSIDSVDTVEPSQIDESDARAAGFPGLAALHAALQQRGDAPVYRIALRLAGPDPRIALRERAPEAPGELDGAALPRGSRRAYGSSKRWV